MRVRVDVLGANAVTSELRRMGYAGRLVIKREFGRFQTRVVPQAKAGAPVDDADGGDLRDSIRPSKITETRKGVISAGVVAGGRRLEKLASESGRKVPGVYAVVQHDDLSLVHDEGGPKFVERPFMRELARLGEGILAGIDEYRQRESTLAGTPLGDVLAGRGGSDDE